MATEIQYDSKNRPILDTQHPEEELDYAVSFANELAKYSDNDTISSATVTAERGITIYSVDFDTQRVGFWAKLGSADNSYIIKVVALTTNGRKMVYELVLPIGYEQLQIA